MRLNQIYQPIRNELADVEQVLKERLRSCKYKSILEINNYLLDNGGKRLRPALVLLSAKASHQVPSSGHKLVNIAAAIELIHMASLVHDDVIDHSSLRHNKPTVNCRKGEDVAIALGDYLYSIAFELISTCGDMEVLQCISSATKAMCEGELLQVCERDNIDVLRERYIMIIKKKTAALFAASCKAGVMLVNQNRITQDTLREYGLNFGIAFQIIDDCLDLIGNERDLGKSPGVDLKMGEITLPVLNLLCQSKDKKRIFSLLKERDKQRALQELKDSFIQSPALIKTQRDTFIYIKKAKDSLDKLSSSSFTQSLSNLADYVIEKIKL